MDDLLDSFSDQGWAIAKREHIGGSRGPNPTRVDVVLNPKQRLSLVLYAWRITGEGKGRSGTNFRIQTTRSHEGDLLSEPNRLTLGFGIDAERGVLAVFDGWTKRNTGGSSSVHIKRALLDGAAEDGFRTYGPPWDSRAASLMSSPARLLPWINDQVKQRLAPVEPLTLDVINESAIVSADLWDSAPAAWLRVGDQLVLTDRERAALVEKSVWTVRGLAVAVTTPGRYPRRKITFNLKRHGRVKDASALLAGFTGSQYT